MKKFKGFSKDDNVLNRTKSAEQKIKKLVKQMLNPPIIQEIKTLFKTNTVQDLGVMPKRRSDAVTYVNPEESSEVVGLEESSEQD